jgi:hypothetical protein
MNSLAVSQSRALLLGFGYFAAVYGLGALLLYAGVLG